MHVAEKAWALMQAKGVPHSAVFYNLMVRGYALRGNVKDVLRVTGEMKAAGFEPSEPNMSALLGCVHCA